MDLIIIEAEPFGEGRCQLSEMTRIREAIRDFKVPKDILVFSLDDVAYWRDSLNNVLARALREGKVLYERPETGPAPSPGGGRGPGHASWTERRRRLH